MTVEFLQRNRAGVFLILFSALAFFFLTLRLEPYVEGIKSAVWFLISPKVVYSGEFFNKFDSLRGRLFRLVAVEGENVILRQQLTDLSKKEIERDALEKENNRLRGVLGLKEKTFPNAVSAEVVGRDLRDWFHMVLINKGDREGIPPAAAVVVSIDGRPTLVGRVVEIGPHTSKVVLITDLVSAISVGFGNRPDIGLLEGRNRQWCTVKYLSQKSDVAPGDDVLTMGLGGVYPPGIPVGKVEDVRLSPDGFFKEAKVWPYTDFGSLQEVLVLERRDLKPLEQPKTK